MMKPNIKNKWAILAALLGPALARLAGLPAGTARAVRRSSRKRPRRWGLLGVLLVLFVALASTAAAQTERSPEKSEVWVVDQRTLVKIHRMSRFAR